MNVDFSLDSLINTANFGVCCIVALMQSFVSSKLAFTEKQKAALYGAMTLISFVIATQKAVVIFDVIAFGYYLFFAALYAHLARKNK